MKDSGVQSGSSISAAANIGESGGPKRILGMWDAVSLIIGIVVGSGIFALPAMVAANSSSEAIFMLVWVLGGVISLFGALCYAELATAFPNTGGDYHFIQRAFGKPLSFLFGWARMTVIQTGSIAVPAFIFGDFTTRIFSLGDYSSAIYASIIIIVLTLINIVGLRSGTITQNLLTIAEVSGILIIIAAGLFFVLPAGAVSTEPATTGISSMGMALIFVLFTFGGWNEAAYISAELKDGKRQIPKALIYSILIITGLYLLVNYTYLKVLGLDGIAGSKAVASDVIHLAFGEPAAILIAVMVAISAVTTANATILTGARTNYTLGRDFPAFKILSKWDEEKSVPLNAFILQAVISLILVAFGLWSGNGVETVVNYTAPVFWTFFLLAGLSVIVLRWKEPDAERPFRVPFYPLPPIIFCLMCGYLLYSSLMYAGTGSLVGLAVLAAGGLVLLGISIFSASNKGENSEDL